MAARAIISVGRLCSRLQRVSIATTCKHGQAASISTHIAGPQAGPGVLPGIFYDVKDTLVSDSETRKDIPWSDSRTRIALDSVSQGLDLEYKCPSLRLVADVAILDIAEKTTTSYDCPNIISIVGQEIVLPNSSSPDQIEMPTTNSNDIGKHAKNILKIRKKMRKKHKLKKWRRKRASEIRKELFEKIKKREAKRDEYLTGIISKGEAFDADTFMEDIMRKAQRGGYRTSLFGEKRDV
ncbi:uncharacterized protein LOC117345146 isoform X2 [Pecten maximus]|uniref:uncharacterized protein LOC117345146 isoform X2 n=1 Tax=Pecten maximus TaxID=6579 RepID=UPI001458F2AD|nr:uncharacterized protein LOC117345146 isoform X2 [Pecten maximus]